MANAIKHILITGSALIFAISLFAYVRVRPRDLQIFIGVGTVGAQGERAPPPPRQTLLAK